MNASPPFWVKMMLLLAIFPSGTIGKHLFGKPAPFCWTFIETAAAAAAAAVAKAKTKPKATPVPTMLRSPKQKLTVLSGKRR